MDCSWAASCPNRGQRCPRFPKRRTPRPKLMRLRRRLDGKPTSERGGSLLAPILILVFRVPPVWAVGTDIAYSTVTKALGSVVHIRQKQVNFKVALWLACGS